MNLSPIEALKRIKDLSDDTTMNPTVIKIWNIAIEALAYEGQDENAINFGTWYSGMAREKVVRAYNRWLNETDASYKAGEDLEPRVQEYLNRRIKELNEADVAFCKDRWDNPDVGMTLKIMAREESNKVTFARQELQEVLKLLSKK